MMANMATMLQQQQQCLDLLTRRSKWGHRSLCQINRNAHRSKWFLYASWSSFFFHLRACINNTTAFNIYNFFSFYHLYNAICLMVYYNIIINLFTQQPKNSIMHYSTLEKCIHLWQFRRELSTQNLKYADLLRSMIQMKRQMVFLSLPYQESLVV